jgi:hypothetical protein
MSSIGTELIGNERLSPKIFSEPARARFGVALRTTTGWRVGTSWHIGMVGAGRATC